ncbi:MAG: hypothetical protein KF900_09360 [Bacteroidetes bacterium]|nr:hypothetical protein [Bacteroidota bacterium]
MAAITIENNGASLKITSGTSVRNIVKAQIIEIAVVQNNIIKIDSGKGALYNVYVPYTDVTQPLTANPTELREAINAMLQGSDGGGTAAGGATEAKQIEELDKLSVIDGLIRDIKATIITLDGKVFFEPVIVDETNPYVIYKGFASPAARPDLEVFAIQKITNHDGIFTYEWADGNKNFDNVWNDRLVLDYK